LGSGKVSEGSKLWGVVEPRGSDAPSLGFQRRSALTRNYRGFSEVLMIEMWVQSSVFKE